MKKLILINLCLLFAFAVGSVYALPIEVPNFASDPSGAQFTIQAVSASDPGSNNLAGLPTLTYGITSPDGTANTMQMSWEQNTAGEDAQAGWELVFGEDPDIRNLQIILSINPPGGWTNAAGVAIGSPGNPGIGDLFQGIKSLQVRAIDNLNVLAGGWGFNTDQDLLLAAGNDLLAAGGVSLQCNFMQTVTINVLNGPVANSATVQGGPGAPAGGFIGPNFLIAGNNNFANIAKLQFFENGILQGGVNVVPGQPVPGLNNYWDHITVTPEPMTLVLLGLGGLLLRRRKR